MASLDYTSVFLVVVTVAVFFVPILILFPPVPVEHSDALQQTHSKLGLSDEQSRLKTQYDASHNSHAGKPSTVANLFIYPVKSCRGVEISRSKVLPTGLEYDRRYLFAQLKPTTTVAAQGVEEDAWEFLTLRQLPLLANVHVEVWLPDCAKTSRQLGKQPGGFLLVRFPWQDKGMLGAIQLLAAKLSRGMSAVPEKAFLLPLEFPSKQEINAKGYNFTQVKIWKDSPVALDMSNEVPPELAVYLGAKNRLGLFRADPSSQREVMRCAPPEQALGYQPVVEFQDAVSSHSLTATGHETNLSCSIRYTC